MARVSFHAASLAVARRDPVMAGLRRKSGPPRFPPKDRHTHFQALLRAIVFQQLHGKAAETIHGRLVAALDGDVNPEAVLALHPRKLRSAGLSGSKAASVRDLAAKASDGTLDLARIARLKDDAVVERLVQVRGIGRWTAEMFLMFRLHRLDVWPVSDFGVRKGFAIAYGLRAMPEPKELLPLGDKFRPYRSIAAWYCWRATETGVLP
jgi:3-methyladenine DNA glycosylase/8-oxoguanine DNA glycosylase